MGKFFLVLGLLQLFAGTGKYPLLHAISDVLGNSRSSGNRVVQVDHTTRIWHEITRGPTQGWQAQTQAPTQAWSTQTQNPTQAWSAQTQGPTQTWQAQTQTPTQAWQAQTQAPTQAWQTQTQGPTQTLQAQTQAPTQAWQAHTQTSTQAQTKAPTQAPSNTNTGTGSSGTVHVRFTCHGKAEGHYADPTNCHKFHECSSGRHFVLTCGAGTVYNPVSKGCDFPYNVPGCSGK